MCSKLLPMQESDMITGLREGNNIAYKLLYQYHYGALCLYAMQIVKNKIDAESIVNEVFIAIWKGRKKCQIDNLRNYLMRSVKNRCINYLIDKKKKSSNIEHYLKVNHNDLLQDTEASTSPVEYILMKELDLKIQKSINQLPIQTKEIFLLSRESSLTYQDIGDKLNVSVDVVKYHIKRALQHLRYNLKEYLSKK